ncbi:polyketide cyclase/dehydrase/lipid transport protein [Ureibacillus xyleni]|uniref:Polyketide cyclase/dehydrase/lipid transport protein n=1 Tax=Ureibacillus xyleni TaxID=614648 RepID=A0A285SEG5_9BACL|nr:SRPBCC family protein [Ureibacillus xyleni]SOC05655.1 polyketide cyclase/dehydrase/lipid transport protein [Ureibacillus xyleni]
MKSWTKEIEINAPIEKVWKLFNGSFEDMQKMMPQVISHEPIHVTEEKIGTIYRQQYREGKRIQEYDVETLDFFDTPNEKRLKVGFNIAQMFDITALYELKKTDNNTTHFVYTTTNEPLKPILKLLLKFSSNKVVVEFVERVKKVAETE